MRAYYFLTLSVLLLMLSGCGEPENIQGWINEVISKKTVPKITPISGQALYNPVPYTQNEQTDPFHNLKLGIGRELDNSLLRGLIGQPDEDARAVRNNILERYPLSSLKMIGHLMLKGKPMAVVVVDKLGLVKQVKVGDYLGHDFGRVTQIDDSQITINEKVQDNNSSWVERKNNIYIEVAAAQEKDPRGGASPGGRR